MLIPGSAPFAPAKPTIWTPGFSVFFVVLAIAGGVVTLVVNILLGNFDTPSVVAIDWLVLVVLGVIALVCLVGLRFVRSNLLRAGLLLQAGSLATNLVIYALVLHQDTSTFDPSLIKWTDVYLPIVLTVLNTASLGVISYGIARWQRGQDTGLLVLHIIVSSGVAYFLLNTLPFNASNNFIITSFWTSEGGSGFLLWITVAAALYAASVFLLRPACWKQHPVLTLLLALGAVLFVLQASGGYLVLERWAEQQHFPFLVYLRILYSAWLLSWLLFMLGFLLLLQTERVRKRAQQVIPAPALVGQHLP